MTFSSIRQSWYSRLISLCLMVTFVTTMIITPRASFAQGVPGLPEPGAMVNLSSSYVPLMLTGLTVHPENPLLMDFIVSTGNTGMNAVQVKKESNRLIKYFLACLTIPENDQWVNLSPYEKERIIPEDLGQTVLGQDMLVQDYLLKQLTASLIYPEKNLGKNFWDKVYAQARQTYGTTQIPVNTFNKVWILPNTAKVYIHNNTVFLVKSHLKVMLDEDYLALQKHKVMHNTMDAVGANIIRQIILPAIEQEVNHGQNFAQLRQIYNSMILAVWFKKNLKQALLNQVYTGKSKVNGVNVDDPSLNEKIYQQYLEAYKKGVFNYIKEEVDHNTQQIIPRKYFSGGLLKPNPAIFSSATEGELIAAVGQGQQGTIFDVRGEQTAASAVNAAMQAEPVNAYKDFYESFGAMDRPLAQTPITQEAVNGFSLKFLTPDAHMLPPNQRRLNETWGVNNEPYGVTEVYFVPEGATQKRMADFQRKLKEEFGSKVYLVDENRLHFTTQGLEQQWDDQTQATKKPLALVSSVEPIATKNVALLEEVKAKALSIVTPEVQMQVARLNFNPQTGIFWELRPYLKDPIDPIKERRKAWGLPEPRPPHITAAYFTQAFTAEEQERLRTLLSSYSDVTHFGDIDVDNVQVIAYSNFAFNASEYDRGYTVLETVPLKKNEAMINFTAKGLERMRAFTKLLQSMWLDFISGSTLKDGSIEAAIEGGVRGITSNPAIFATAITKSSFYDDRIKALATAGLDSKQIYERLAVTDIQSAADKLMPVYTESKGNDGYISLEIDPTLADDADASIAEGIRLWTTVKRPNLMVKVPVTETNAGYEVIKALIAKGINVNVTLLFSPDQYEKQALAVQEGLKQLSETKPEDIIGHGIREVRSVASFFVSRVDVEVDARIEKLAKADNTAVSALKGKAAIANATIAYGEYKRLFSGERWERLASMGAVKQKVLWASTGVKDKKAYPETMYVTNLITDEPSVNTAPVDTINAFVNSDDAIEPVLTGSEEQVASAKAVIQELETAAGINMNDVFSVLTTEGKQKFVDPFTQLLAAIEKKSQEPMTAEEAVPAIVKEFGVQMVADMDAMNGLTKEQAAAVASNPFSTIGFDGKDNRMGWILSNLTEILKHPQMLEQTIQDAQLMQGRPVIISGMGGSGLSTQTVNSTFVNDNTSGRQPISLRSTDPTVIKEILEGLVLQYRKSLNDEKFSLKDLLKILIVPVISKSGTTAETESHLRYFANLYKAQGVDPVGHFILFTDPGSPMDWKAHLGDAQKTDRQIFLEELQPIVRTIQINNKTDVGGRFTAPTTNVFLLPLALQFGASDEARARILKILESAVEMNSQPVEQDQFIRLAAFLYYMASAQHRDKVTFIVPEEFKDLPMWSEQLFEESLGKDGKGVTVIYGEDLDMNKLKGVDQNDRVFLRINFGGQETRKELFDQLNASGYPVFDINVASVDQIGGLMLGLERTVAFVGYLWDIVFTNQPGVEGYKKGTREVMASIQSGQKVQVPSEWETGKATYGKVLDVYYQPILEAGIQREQLISDLHSWIFSGVQEMPAELRFRVQQVASISEKEASVLTKNNLGPIFTKIRKGIITENDIDQELKRLKAGRNNAPAVYAAFLNVAHAKGLMEIVETLSYGRMSPEFAAILQQSRSIYTDSFQVATKLGEGPDINHSYVQNNANGRDMIFNTFIMPNVAAQPDPIVLGIPLAAGALSYDENLLRAPTIGTVKSLIEVGRRAVLIKLHKGIKELDGEDRQQIESFFSEVSKYLPGGGQTKAVEEFHARLGAFEKNFQDAEQQYKRVNAHNPTLIAEVRAAIKQLRESTDSIEAQQQRLDALGGDVKVIDLMESLYQDHETLLKRLPATNGYKLATPEATRKYHDTKRDITVRLKANLPQNAFASIVGLSDLKDQYSVISTYEEAIVNRSIAELNVINNPANTQGQVQNWVDQEYQMSDFPIDMRRTYDFRHEGGFLKASDFFAEAVAHGTLSVDEAKRNGIPSQEWTAVVGRDARLIEPENVDAYIAGLKVAGIRKIIFIAAEGPNCVTSYSAAVQKYKPLLSILFTASHVSRSRRTFVRGMKVKTRATSFSKGGRLLGLVTDQIKNKTYEMVKGIVDALGSKYHFMEAYKAREAAYMDEYKAKAVPQEFINVTDAEKDAIKLNTLIGHVALDPEGDLYSLAKELRGARTPEFFDYVVAREGQKYDAQKPFVGKTIVVDGGHTPSILAADVFRNLGAEVFPIRANLEEVNGEHTVDPSITTNNRQMFDEMRRVGAQFGIGFDLDGDRGAMILYSIDENGTEKKIRFDNLSQDDMFVFQLDSQASKNAIKSIILDGKKPAVVADVLSSYSVEAAAEKVGKELTAEMGQEVKIEVIRTDAGYVFLEQEAARLEAEGYVVVNALEKSGHGWSMETGEIENPVAVAVKFIAAMQEKMRTGEEQDPAKIFTKAVDQFASRKSPRFQPPIDLPFLEKSAEDPRNITRWTPSSSEKMPQIIVELARHQMVKLLDEEPQFQLDKIISIPLADGTTRHLKVASKFVQKGEKVDNLYRYIDIRFSDADDPSGRIVFRYVARGSSNDPSFVDIYEAPVDPSNPNGEKLAEEWKILGSGVINEFLMENRVALITPKSLQASGMRGDLNSIFEKANLAPVAEDYKQYLALTGKNEAMAAPRKKQGPVIEIQGIPDDDDLQGSSPVVGPLPSVDRAALALKESGPGGIDLNSRNLNLESFGEKVNITFDPAMVAQFRRGDFSGVKIKILDVFQINLMPLLGLREDEESGKLAKA